MSVQCSLRSRRRAHCSASSSAFSSASTAATNGAYDAAGSGRLANMRVARTPSDTMWVLPRACSQALPRPAIPRFGDCAHGARWR